LTGYFVLAGAIFYFENAHYISINRTFKAKTENKRSLSKIVVYLFRIPYLKKYTFYKILLNNFPFNSFNNGF